MSKSDHSSFWTTGIWVLLRYLALPILICAGIYLFGGTANRAKINYRLASAILPFQEAVARLTGNAEFLEARMHVRDPDLAGMGVVQLSDLPVAAEVPVVNLKDLKAVEGPGRVNLSDLPEPIEDTVVFLITKPEADPNKVLAVTHSPRPLSRPEISELVPSQTPLRDCGAEQRCR